MTVHHLPLFPEEMNIIMFLSFPPKLHLSLLVFRFPSVIFFFGSAAKHVPFPAIAILTPPLPPVCHVSFENIISFFVNSSSFADAFFLVPFFFFPPKASLFFSF